MKSTTHTYLKAESGFCGLKKINQTYSDVSEVKHMEMLDQLTSRFSFERFAKTTAEKAELKYRMSLYPNKNHRPIS